MRIDGSPFPDPEKELKKAGGEMPPAFFISNYTDNEGLGY
jgi:hypothetical protein